MDLSTGSHEKPFQLLTQFHQFCLKFPSQTMFELLQKNKFQNVKVRRVWWLTCKPYVPPNCLGSLHKCLVVHINVCLCIVLLDEYWQVPFLLWPFFFDCGLENVYITPTYIWWITSPRDLQNRISYPFNYSKTIHLTPWVVLLSDFS